MPSTKNKGTQPRTKPTFKQKRFVEEYIKNNGNGRQAALKVYNAKDNHSATCIAQENLTKPVIISEIERVMEENGLNNELIIKKHKQLVMSNDLNHSKNGIDMYYKIKGAYQSTNQSSSSQYNYFFMLSNEERKQKIQELSSKLLQQNNNNNPPTTQSAN